MQAAGTTTVTGIIDSSYTSQSDEKRGSEQKIMLVDISSKERILVLIRDVKGDIHSYHVGHPMTVRGRYLQHAKEQVRTLCPDALSKGYVRCDGRVTKW